MDSKLGPRAKQFLFHWAGLGWVGLGCCSHSGTVRCFVFVHKINLKELTIWHYMKRMVGGVPPVFKY